LEQPNRLSLRECAWSKVCSSDHMLVMGHLNLGETYVIAGQKEKALASLKKAHQMCQEMGHGLLPGQDGEGAGEAASLTPPSCGTTMPD